MAYAASLHVALKHNKSAGRACGILNPARLERRIVPALWLTNPQGEPAVF